ncbi:MAG: FkbM family methyltransferase [Rhodospirillaceae bacterium]
MSKTYSAILGGLVRALSAPMPRWSRIATRARLAEAVMPRVTVATPAGPVTFYTPGKEAIYFPRHAYKREPETLEWIDGFGPDEVFWDVGASLGPYSIYAGKRGVRTVALEPNPFSFHCLVRNIAENRISDRVAAYCLGLAEKDGRERFFMPSFEAGTSGSSLKEAGLSRLGFARPDIAVDALAFRAERLVDDLGFPAPNHVKIDVDSIEKQIIEGALPLLSRSEVKSLLIEIAPDDREIPALLAKAGLEEWRRGQTRADTDVNVIFRRPG